MPAAKALQRLKCIKCIKSEGNLTRGAWRHDDRPKSEDQIYTRARFQGRVVMQRLICARINTSAGTRGITVPRSQLCRAQVRRQGKWEGCAFRLDHMVILIFL